jgi:hypothetical protein
VVVGAETRRLLTSDQLGLLGSCGGMPQAEIEEELPLSQDSVMIVGELHCT